MNRPRLFLSAVSEELRSARQAVAATVRTLGFDPVSQDDFPTGYGELRNWLREQIDSCEGLIQLVGHGYGAEPAEVDPDYGRVSYTQLEFLYAGLRGKKTWVIVIGDRCRRDKPIDQLDLPREPGHADPAAYQAERHKLQQEYIARLIRENHLRHTANNDTELQNIILRLRDELGELRMKWDEWLEYIIAGPTRLTEHNIRVDLLRAFGESYRRELAEMADIFISYASEDMDRVIPIVKALEEWGWSTFWDCKSIPVGRTWRQFVQEGLSQARSVLVLWSKKSIESEYVIEEADFGKKKKILIPAFIDEVDPPFGFKQIQAARLMGWEGELSHAGYQRLLKALAYLLGVPKIHEPKRKSLPLEKIANIFGMEFVLIPAGSFTMGMGNQVISASMPVKMIDLGGLKEYFGPAKPQHDVKIEQPFYLQTTAVTQNHWRRVMGNTPSYFKNCGDDCPVEQVSWEDAHQLIDKLNRTEKTKSYRLPNEAEWEYACRAGSETAFFFGGWNGPLSEFAWYSLNSEGRTHPVGEKKPNPWGLYDMYGNVCEWVEDDWHDSYEGAPAEGIAWVDNPRSSYRVIRGGSWESDAYYCSSAMRFTYWSDHRFNVVGIRLAMSVALGP